MGRRYTLQQPNLTLTIKNSVTNRETITNEGSHVSMSAIAIPLAELGVPIAYVAGTQLILSPQIWWYGNLRPIIHESIETFTETDVIKHKTSPFSLFVYETTTTMETVIITRTVIGYYLSMQFGVCLGPDAALRGIYVNGRKIWSGSIGPGRTEFVVPQNDSFINGTCIWSGGSFTQAPDSYLAQHISPAQLPGYVGMAHLIVKDLRADQTQGRVSFEVSRFPNRLGLSAGNNRSGDDINIASAMADFIASDWGGSGAGMDVVDTGTFTTSALRLATENNFCSIILNQENDATVVLKALSDQADGILFEDPSIKKVRFKLIRFDQLNSLTGITLDDNAIARVSSWERQSWVGTANKVRVTFTSRTKGYDIDSMVGYNFAAINDRIKANRSMRLDFPACMSAGVAQSLLSYNLGLVGKPLVRAVVETNRKASSLLPGDTVRLLPSGRGLGPVLGVATKVQRFPLQDNRTLINFQQVARQDNDIVFDKDDESLGDDFNIQIDAPSAITILQAPYWIARRRGVTFVQSQVETAKFVMPLFLPTRVDNVQSSFGAYIMNHPDMADPVRVLQGSEYPTVAQLAVAVGQFDGIDTGTLASITISNVVGGEHLTSLGNTGVRQGQVLIMIGTEIMGFETALNNGDGTWTLSTVHRGLIDTAPRAHAAGAALHVVGNNNSYLGETIAHPLGYTPQWRITSNTPYAFGDPEIADHFIGTAVWDVAASRIHPPIRPHDTKIDGAARSTSLTNELGEVGTIVQLEQALAITWKVRHKASARITLQADAAEVAEIDDSDPDAVVYTRYRVMIRDRTDVLRDAGVTDEDDSYNAKAATVPSDTALGLGYLFIRAENSYGNSLYEDQVPVYVLSEGYYVREEEDEYYISEDDQFLYVGEGAG